MTSYLCALAEPRASKAVRPPTWRFYYVKVSAVNRAARQHT